MLNRIDIAASVVRSRIDALVRTYPELQEDAEALAGALEGETDLHEVAERILDAELESVVISNAIRARSADLNERRGRFDRRVDALRALLKSLMDAAGIDKLMLPEATISVRKGTDSAFITDEEAVPSQLCKVTRTPDRAAIKERLKAGEEIPGAMLLRGEPTLSIRTK